jgi:hypothetical protein
VIAVMRVQQRCVGCVERNMTRQRVMCLFLAPTVIKQQREKCKEREGECREGK